MEWAIDPAYRDDESTGTEDYSFEEIEEDSPNSTTLTGPQESAAHQPPTQSISSSSFFTQDYINNSQLAFLIIKRQLMLLVHANYCIKIDNMFPDRPKCDMQSCDVFKRVLEHLKVCQTLQCDTPRCISSRNILRHYCNCYNINCQICF